MSSHTQLYGNRENWQKLWQIACEVPNLSLKCFTAKAYTINTEGLAVANYVRSWFACNYGCMYILLSLLKIIPFIVNG